MGTAIHRRRFSKPEHRLLLIMDRGPLQRLTDEEITFLRQRFRVEVRDDRELYQKLGSDRRLMEWMEQRILITADHFKLRYSKSDD